MVEILMVFQTLLSLPFNTEGLPSPGPCAVRSVCATEVLPLDLQKACVSLLGLAIKSFDRGLSLSLPKAFEKEKPSSCSSKCEETLSPVLWALVKV